MISKGFLQSESKNLNRWKSLRNHKSQKLTSPRLRNYHHRFYHKLNAWREEKNHLKWVKSKDSSANKKKRTNSLVKMKPLKDRENFYEVPEFCPPGYTKE